jgi:hypothetical protein
MPDSGLPVGLTLGLPPGSILAKFLVLLELAKSIT